MTSLSQPSPRHDAHPVAFVRGIEHRGLVFAENQCGHAGRARTATLAAKAEFHERAARTDADGWTVLYWRSLLAQPALRERLRRDARNPFSLLDAGPRAVLLLRFVAEIEAVDGAQALAISPEAYRHALFRATETLRENGIDESWLRALRDRLRNDARPTHADPPEATTADDAVRTIPRWLRPSLIGALALLLVAGIGSYFWHPAFLGPRIVGGIETLRDHKPAQVLPATAQLLASGDFAQMNDPQGAAIARDLDLLSWYAASAGASTPPATPSAPLPETTQPENGATEVDTDSNGGGHAP